MSELPPEGYPEGSRRVWGLTIKGASSVGSRDAPHWTLSPWSWVRVSTEAKENA